MRHRPLLSGVAAAVLLVAAAPALAEAPAATAAATAPAQAAEPFTWRDMIRANRLGDPQVSPDGRWVVYSVTTTDVDANRRSGSLYIMDLQEPGEGRRLAISEGGANTARWGADGKLYFLSGRSGSSQVWRANADGTGPVQVTDLPVDVNAYRLSRDAGKLVVSLAVFPSCADLACTVDRSKAEADDKTTGQVYDRMFVRHWDTWNDGTQNHLFVVNTDGSDWAASRAVEHKFRPLPHQRAERRRHVREPDRRQRRLGHRPGVLARRPHPRVPRHGPAGLRG